MRRVLLGAGVAWLIAVVAFGAAYGVNAAVGVLVAPKDAPASHLLVAGAASERGPVAPGGVQRALSEAQYLDGIMRRNLFDPDAIAAWNPQPADGRPGVARSDLKLKLCCTIVAIPETYSSAWIEDEGTAEHAQRGYGVGAEIVGSNGTLVVAIERRRVKLRDAAGVESYLLAGEESAPEVADAGEPGEGASEGNDFGITTVGENKFSVPRDVIDKNLADLEGLSRMGRALLHRGPDGEFDGYRLSAIRRGTIADALGIRNGDVIHSVNGQPLNSMQAAMNAYQTMQSGSSFAFEVTRRGERVNLEYDVH